MNFQGNEVERSIYLIRTLDGRKVGSSLYFSRLGFCGFYAQLLRHPSRNDWVMASQLCGFQETEHLTAWSIFMFCTRQEIVTS
jgi:hypothetical protein